jgi:hypothetical protein
MSEPQPIVAMPEGWVDDDEDDGLPDEQPPDCDPEDLLRMPIESL